MGYTHYWTANPAKKPSAKQWKQIINAAWQVFMDNKDILAKDNQEDAFMVSDSVIVFNGIEEDAHETFFLDRDKDGFDFCKTNRKPYDKAVVSMLKEVKAICPEWLELSSDGGKKVFG